MGEPGLQSGVADADGEMLSLMEEAKRVRAAAQSGALSDAQRRKAAADVTLRLMAMLGGSLGDGDDEEEEDGDKGGSSGGVASKE
jgi:hypothetical protein